MSLRSMFSNIFSSLGAKLESRVYQLISIKTIDIVDSVSTTMADMLKSIKADMFSVSERATRDNQIMANELNRLDDSLGLKMHTF